MSKSHYTDPPSEKQIKKNEQYISDDEEIVILTGLSEHYIKHKAVILFSIWLLIFYIGGFVANFFLKQNIFLILATAILLATFLTAIQVYILAESVRYILTNKKLVVKKGYFQINIYSAAYDKITHIEVDQGIVDRIFFHYGHIMVHTAGQSSKEIELSHIDAPIEFKNVLERLIHHERKNYSE